MEGVAPTPLFLEWVFGVVLGVFWLFGGFFWVFLCRVCYCIATEQLLFCLKRLWGWVPGVFRVCFGVWSCFGGLRVGVAMRESDPRARYSEFFVNSEVKQKVWGAIVLVHTMPMNQVSCLVLSLSFR